MLIVIWNVVIITRNIVLTADANRYICAIADPIDIISESLGNKAYWNHGAPASNNSRSSHLNLSTIYGRIIAANRHSDADTVEGSSGAIEIGIPINRTAKALNNTAYWTYDRFLKKWIMLH